MLSEVDTFGGEDKDAAVGFGYQALLLKVPGYRLKNSVAATTIHRRTEVVILQTLFSLSAGSLSANLQRGEAQGKILQQRRVCRIDEALQFIRI